MPVASLPRTCAAVLLLCFPMATCRADQPAASILTPTLPARATPGTAPGQPPADVAARRLPNVEVTGHTAVTSTLPQPVKQPSLAPSPRQSLMLILLQHSVSRSQRTAAKSTTSELTQTESRRIVHVVR